MNYRQVHALERLMRWAAPLRLMYATEDEPVAELLVDLEVMDGKDDGASGAPFGGSTYSARLWTVESGYYFPDRFYVRSDGLVYTYDSETDDSHEVKGVRWAGPRTLMPEDSRQMIDWRLRLVADAAEEALAR